MKHLVLVLGIMLLTACKSTPWVSPYAQPLAPNQGVVVLRASFNSDSLDPGHFTNFNTLSWAVLETVGAKKKKKHYLQANDKEHWAYKSSFDLNQSLPAGEYKLLEVGGAWGGVISREFDVRANNLVFQVEPGKIVNLGHIVVQPLGDGKFLSIPLPEPSVAETFISKTPLLAHWEVTEPLSATDVHSAESSTDSADIASLGWGGSLLAGGIMSMISSANEREVNPTWKAVRTHTEALSAAKQVSYAANTFVELPNGKLFVGSNLGQVLVRNTDGSWHNLETGSLSAITAMAVQDAANILVGGEHGLLKITRDHGISWTELPSPKPYSLALDLVPYNKGFIGLFKRGNSVTAYQLANVDTAEWKRLASLPNSSEPPTKFGERTSGGALIADKYLISNTSGQITVVDLTSGDVSNIQTPFKQTSRFTATADDTLLITEGFIKIYQSTDQGQTWSRIDTPCGRPLQMAVGTENQTFTVCAGYGMSMSTVIDKYGLGTKKQVKDKRIKAKEVFDNGLLQTLYASPFQNLVIAVDIDGLIYTSSDGGLSWNKEKKS